MLSSSIVVFPPREPDPSGRTAYISRISGGINVSLSLLSSFSGSMTIIR